MMAAPEMSPTLDDAIRALDGAAVNGVIRPAQLLNVTMFLDQLDHVRECAAVIPDQAQAAALEGAYQAGFRCADESGHVLVVSLPALLAYIGHAVPAPRVSWRAKLTQLLAPRTVPVTPRPPVAPGLSLVPRCSYPECVCSFNRMVAGCQSHKK